MRLLFISHSSDCNGGGEKCLISLMKGLKSIHPDWELYLIIPSDGNKTILDACGKCLSGHKVMSLRWWLRSKKTSAWKKFFFSYRIFRKVTSLLLFMKKIRPDLCVTNTIVIPYLAMACRISHTPHCWFIHEIPWLTWKLNFVFDDKRIFRIIDKSSQKIIVPSKFTGQFYADKGITANKIASIAQSVEISPITDRQRRHSCYTILLIGSFAANKGQLELLKAVDIVVKRGIDILCILAGADNNSGFRELCDRFVTEHSLSGHVEMYHFTEDIASLYHEADVVAVCSRMETFGRTVAEARICGLPVIAARTGAIPEQINDGVDGLLYEPGNAAELADKIEFLSNPEERKRMSENIPKDLKTKYSTENFASSFCKKLSLPAK